MSNKPTRAMNIYRHIPDLASLEREYSPSSCVDDIQSYLDAYAQRSLEARQALRMRTHHYGDSPEECLDYFPATDDDAPLLVFIHGGYWQQLSKADASFPAIQCQRHGIAYAALNYGLAPAVSLTQMIERCRRAMEWLHEHATQLGFNPNRIIISGSSAGAHLAAMTLLTADQAMQPQLRGGVLLSGIYDLEPLLPTYVNEPLHLDLTTAKACSPMLALAEARHRLPPLLVAYGDNETSEFKRQSDEFASALTARGTSIQQLCIPARNHFDIVFDLVDESSLLGRHTLQMIAATC